MLRLAHLAAPDYNLVQRNLALELVRVTEAAALAAGRWLGKVLFFLFSFLLAVVEGETTA
jgi:hypothetical protein